MKKSILSFVIVTLGFIICNGQAVQKTAIQEAGTIEAYYFHFKTRCVTCRAVEAEAKADIESLYPGKSTFKAINLDDASSKPLADQLKISGQTLLVVKGDKKINLTNDGFMYATTNPVKFKAVIKQKVDALLTDN
jgi:hypothetical protein